MDSEFERRVEQRFEHIEERFEHMDQRFEHMDQRLDQFKEQLIAVIVDMGSSLHTQIQDLEKRLRAEMNLGFERVEARLGRHGGLIQGGAKQITRLVEWSERVDEMIRERDKKIAELDDRLRRLESNGNPN
jgi:hypothetical protein